MGMRQGSGKPTEAKDRSAHDAARGKRLKSLADLSREFPSGEDLAGFVDTLAAESSDRTAAIMAAALLEQALYTCINSRLADAGESVRHTWFDAPNAPFGTYSAQIKLGRALGIYGPIMEKTLSTIKDIRNVFAHRSSPIDFNDPTISRHVRALADAPLIGDTPIKTRYCAICVRIAKALIEDAFKHGGKEIELSFP